MSIQTLNAAQCRRLCDPDQFTFTTTAELEATDTIIGQPRGARAIEFGINIKSHGYNIYVLGEVGTGRTTAIMRFLGEKSKEKPVPCDWIYVNNFVTPHQPRAIGFPPGEGKLFQSEITTLLRHLSEDLPKAFAGEAYNEAVEIMGKEFEQQRAQRLQALQQKAAQNSLAIVNTPSGYGLAVVQNGQILDAAAFQQLPLDQQNELQQHQDVLAEELETLLTELFRLEEILRQKLDRLQREVAAATIMHHFTRLKNRYTEHGEVQLYLNEMYNDILDTVETFQPDADADEAAPPPK